MPSVVWVVAVCRSSGVLWLYFPSSYSVGCAKRGAIFVRLNAKKFLLLLLTRPSVSSTSEYAPFHLIYRYCGTIKSLISSSHDIIDSGRKWRNIAAPPSATIHISKTSLNIDAEDGMEHLRIACSNSSRPTIFCMQSLLEIDSAPESQSPISEAIMDRIIHNSYEIIVEYRGSMREHKEPRTVSRKNDKTDCVIDLIKYKLPLQLPSILI